MAFPQQFLDELVARNDITDVVGSYIQLTKRSGSNLFGLCPFHSEKTPSFSVSSDKQIYHCFGCGKGGGVINFIMEIENLSFPDAVHFLAKRVGMTVPEDDSSKESRGRRTRMLELNRDAARFFYETLSTQAGASAVDYIGRRGISKAMVKRFGLGAAPDSWNALFDAMTKKGYTAYELVDAGLAKKGKNGGYYDTFRNRLMFPVIDVRGSVIGFSGRILDDGEPKYLNSPDTLVFNKSRNLFGLNLARKSKEGKLILVEGNIDVVSMHQAGFDCTVASLGTSLTAEQARLMARYTDTVVIAYDADGAGVKAAKRAIDILEKTGLNIRVLQMDGAKDPDEFIQKRGADAFRLLLDKSENHIEYQILSVKSKYDLAADDGRLGFIAEATQLLAGIPNAVEREVYGRRVAEMANISPEALSSEVKKAYRKNVAAQKKRADRDAMRPSLTAQPRERQMQYKDVRSAVAEEGVIRLILLDPELINMTNDLKAEEFTSEFLGKTYSVLKERYLRGDSISIPQLSSEFDANEISCLTEIMQKPERAERRRQAMEEYINKIRTEKMKKEAKNNLMALAEKYRQTKAYGG